MNYNKRIGDDYLKADWQDGEIIQHTDLNEIETVVKEAVNANYTDIQKILDGTYNVGSADSISGTSLSKYADEELQNTDDKVPSSLQVKAYVDAAKQAAIDSIPDDVSSFNNDAGYITNSTEGLTNYYKKSETYTQAEVQAYVKAVEDLDNYYKKSDTYTKTETQNLVNTLISATIQVVESLPQTGQPNVIYFVPKAHTETNNVYDEFVWIENAWENIGDTELDNLDIDVSKSGHTATVTITKRNGTTKSVEIYDGVTPDTQIGTVQTLPAGSNAVVTRTGTDAAPVLNFGIPRGAAGEDGADGADGADGFSPSASVSQSGDVTTITITDKNGTTTANIDLSSVGGGGVVITPQNRTNSTIIASVDNEYQKFLNDEAYSVLVKKSIADWYTYTSPLYFYYSSSSSVFLTNYMLTDILSNDTRKGELISVSLTITDGHVTAISTIDVISLNAGTGGQTSATLLTDKNTYQYTPTGDYHPTPKLYVDGAVSSVLACIAPAYSSSSTYAIDDLVTYNKVLYKCTTAVTTAEAFDSSKWAVTDIVDNLSSGGGSSFVAKSLSVLRDTGTTNSPIDFTTAEVGIYVNDIANYDSFYYKNVVNPSQSGTSSCSYKPYLLIVEKETGTVAPSSGFFFAWMYAFNTSGDLYLLHFYVNSVGQVNKDDTLITSSSSVQPSFEIAFLSTNSTTKDTLTSWYSAWDKSMNLPELIAYDGSGSTRYVKMKAIETNKYSLANDYTGSLTIRFMFVSVPSGSGYTSSVSSNWLSLNLTNGVVTSVSWTNGGGYNILAKDVNATITATHTYSTLPQSSVTPTTNNQLTNKKYVDDSIAAAITTTLGGSY